MVAVDSSEVSNTASVGMIPRFYDLGGTGSPALNVNRTYLYGNDARVDDIATLHVRRDVSYTGGTAAFLNSALLVESNVTTTANPFDCGLFVVQQNQSNGGQNFAMGSQANKLGQGPAWALVTETHEKNAMPDPTTGTLGYELDIHANGTDANLQRIAIAIIAKREDPSGAPMTLGVGISIENGDPSGAARISRGLMFGRNGATDFDYCIDTSHATFSTNGAAILLGQGQAISFKGDATRRISYLPAVSRLRYEGPGGHIFDFTDEGQFNITGGYQIFGEQVVTVRQRGWGANTGPTSREGFDTSSVTLQKLAQTLAALINDLQTHGLIGPS